MHDCTFFYFAERCQVHSMYAACYHTCCRLRRERRGPSNSRTCSETFGQLIAEGISREELFKAITEQVGVCGGDLFASGRATVSNWHQPVVRHCILLEIKRDTGTYCQPSTSRFWPSLCSWYICGCLNLGLLTLAVCRAWTLC